MLLGHPVYYIMQSVKNNQDISNKKNTVPEFFKN